MSTLDVICGPCPRPHQPRHVPRKSQGAGPQHPEEQQELPELPLHGFLTLLEVPVLWAEGLVRAKSPGACEGPASTLP